MAIDPNLAMNIGRYGATQMPDYGNMLAQATNIQGARQTQQMNALKMQEAQLAQQSQQQLNALVNANLTPKGQVNWDALIPAAAERGLPTMPLMQARQAEAAKQANIDKDAAAAAEKIVQSNIAKIKTSQQMFSAVGDQQQHEATLAELAQMFGPEWAGKFPTVYDPKDPEWRRMQLLDPKELIPSTIVVDLDGVKKLVTLDKRTGKPIRVEDYEVQPYSADVERQKKDLRPVGTTVNLSPGERQTEIKRADELADEAKAVREGDRLARATLPSMQVMRSLLDKGLETGLGTWSKELAARVMGDVFGVKNAQEFAGNVQTFRAQSMQQVLNKQLLQKGPQTEADARRMEQTFAQLGNTTEANKFLVDMATAQFKRDQDQHNFYQKWFRDNKTYEGAEQAWLAGEGGKSIFERPELKKYGVEQPQGAPAVGTVQDGWRFKGGDPADKNNWEKVTR